MSGIYISSRKAVKFMIEHAKYKLIGTTGHWCLFGVEA